MKPYLALFGLSIPTYSVFYFGALPVFAAIAALVLRRGRERTAAAVDLAILMGLGYTVGARVLGALAGAEWDFFRDLDPGKLEGALWGGQAAFGALAIVYLVASRLPASTLGDALAVGWAWATVLHKTGCFFAGCCGGAPADLPWAVIFPKGKAPVHPTQLYDAGAALLIGAALTVALARGKARGRLLLWWLLAFAATRFATEPTRSEVRFPIAEGVSAAMIPEVVVFVIAAALLVRPASWDRALGWLDARAVAVAAPPGLERAGRIVALAAADAVLALALAGGAAFATGNIAAGALVWMAYYVIGNLALGAGPVTRGLGLRSARADGDSPGPLRRLLRGLTEALTPFTVLGLARPWMDREHRPVADAFAGTFLVRAQSARVKI